VPDGAHGIWNGRNAVFYGKVGRILSEFRRWEIYRRAYRAFEESLLYAGRCPYLFESSATQRIAYADDVRRCASDQHSSVPSILCALRRGSHENREILPCASGSRGVSESFDVGGGSDIGGTKRKITGIDGKLEKRGPAIFLSRSIHVHASGFRAAAILQGSIQGLGIGLKIAIA